jgi:phosphatidate cytidylyltransferase
MRVASGATDTPANSWEWPDLLQQRIFTAIVALAVLGAVLFVVPSFVARAVIAALFLAAAWEWAAFLLATDRRSRVVYVVFIALLMGMFLLNIPDAGLVHDVFAVALAWWAVALVWLLFFPTRIRQAVSWLCGALVLVPAWLALDFLYRYAADLLLFLLLIVWAADIGAYFVGRGFGRVKLAPQISPGKTWEGVLGGLCAVLLLATAGSQIVGIEMSTLVPFCMAVAMLSVVGDLTVSMFKRNAGLKDSGSLFPGHGGVLDRIDSVTAAAPLFVLVLTLLGIE